MMNKRVAEKTNEKRRYPFGSYTIEEMICLVIRKRDNVLMELQRYETLIFVGRRV
jgi:hypothetical protein